MKAAVYDGRIDSMPMITERIRIDDIVSCGFAELLFNRDRQLKILVQPN